LLLGPNISYPYHLASRCGKRVIVGDNFDKLSASQSDAYPHFESDRGSVSNETRKSLLMLVIALYDEASRLP